MAPGSRAYVAIPARGAAVARLACVPYAGGGTAVFRGWRLPDVELLAVRLPGRENRTHEAPLRSIAQMAEHVAAELPVGGLPLALFGHSMGALVAFEAARRLPRGEAGPLLLIAAGSPSPAVARDTDPLHALDDKQLIARIEEAFGELPAEVKKDRELMQMVLPSLRADLEADETYVYAPGEPLSCPLLVLAGTDEALDEDALDGWRGQTSGPVTIRHVPGDHFFIRTTPDAVLRLIRDEIADALAER
jgi:medium-chain acyl-[acyl-carrier-protein] hydrolase